MKQTKLQLVQRVTELLNTNRSLAGANVALSAKLFTASLRAIRTVGALSETISERDKLTTLLKDERDEVSRLRGLLADRIEYDRMRGPSVPCHVVTDYSLANEWAQSDACRQRIDADYERSKVSADTASIMHRGRRLKTCLS